MEDQLPTLEWSDRRSKAMEFLLSVVGLLLLACAPAIVAVCYRWGF